MSDSIQNTDRFDRADATQSNYSGGLINGISDSDWAKTRPQTQSGLEPSSQAQDMLKSCPLDITICSGDGNGARISVPSMHDRMSDNQGRKPLNLVEETDKDQAYARRMGAVKRQATDFVEKNMSPAEMKQLRDDMQKYKPAYEAWEKSFATWAGLNPPEQPTKPASWVKYQNAVKEQMNKLLTPKERQNEPAFSMDMGAGNRTSLQAGKTTKADNLDLNQVDSSIKASNMHRELLVEVDPNSQAADTTEKQEQKEGMPGVPVITNDDMKIGLTARREKYDLEQEETAPPSSTENLQFRYISRQEKYRSEQVIRE